MSSGNPETRDRILASAWRLLEAAGGREVRMSDIAKEAGVSRQALYLHFPARADLLVATTRHIDEVKDADARLAKSRAARTGAARLDAFIEAWGNYIPEIYGVAKALMLMAEEDADARQAWENRMQAVREGCQAVVDALEKDGALSPAHSNRHATDFLWTLLSVRSWEQFTSGCGWSQKVYIGKVRAFAREVLIGAPADR
jgi:AcrR family transcriptional regulator